jgi:GNAT superfamily N-acetyltransferase
MFDGVDSPLTQTFGLGMFQPADDSTLIEIEEFFRSHGTAANHEICPLAGVALAQTLATRGYLPCEMSNVLFLDLTERRDDLLRPTELVSHIVGATDTESYTRTSAEGWAEMPEVSHLMQEMTRVMLAAKGYIGFLAEQGGEAIASAGLVVHAGAALLAGASTIPKARGQGAQQALLSARLRHAADLGCDLAMMVAEPGSASQRNAERSGFRIAYTRTKWRHALDMMPNGCREPNSSK